MDEAPRREIVATGSWLYDGTVPRPVYVVRLDYDFWYEIGRAGGDLAPGEEPQLDDGFRYYSSFHGIKEDGSFWAEDPGHPTIGAAKAEAERRAPSPIEWE